MTPPAARVRVELGPRGYDVLVGPGTLAGLAAALLGALAPRKPARVALVHDDRLPVALVERVVGSLAALAPSVVTVAVHASEPEKSLATLENILRDLTLARLERWDPLIALGGGIVGDVAGFAAATYRRGIPFAQCPTTLLSMVDASVGGKTGVNLALGGGLRKNMIGAFWQPRLVVADTSTLGTLPDRELRAGLAECLKHGLLSAGLGDPDLFHWTTSRAQAVLARDPAVLGELVARNVALKARVVGGDEREEAPDAEGGRALLNLGHTFGHAIEPLPGLALDTGVRAPLLHGEAIALGLVAAAHASRAAGLADAALPGAVEAALQASGLPTRASGLPDDGHLIRLMADDKKASGGQLRLILPTRIGESRVVAGPPRDAVVAGWRAIRA